MKLSQERLKEIDEEYKEIRKTKSSLEAPWVWLSSKGAIRIESYKFEQWPFKGEYKEGIRISVVGSEPGQRVLYDVFSDEFYQYQEWKRTGRKSYNIANFGIDENRNKEQTDTRATKTRSNVQEFSSEDIPFG